jgi:hypothetical protein
MNSSSTAFRRLKTMYLTFHFPSARVYAGGWLSNAIFQEYGYIPSHCKYFDSRPPRHYQLDLPLPFFLHDSTRQARDLNVKASLEFEFAEKFSRRKRGPFWRTADSICLNCWNRAGGESFMDWAKPFCIIYKEKRGRLSRKRGHSDVSVNWVL